MAVTPSRTEAPADDRAPLVGEAGCLTRLCVETEQLPYKSPAIPEEGTATLPDGEDVATYDAYGTGATLYPFRASADSTPEQAGVVRAARKFFDATWDNLATKAPF
ncbi:hypothetical protein [Streptomyces sp. NPDC049970]|uniref:hypothetical protein n=1 Tax=Streptomyces sp. NPDC049970 TaxID=3155033 RepID=UPI00343F42CA